MPNTTRTILTSALILVACGDPMVDPTEDGGTPPPPEDAGMIAAPDAATPPTDAGAAMPDAAIEGPAVHVHLRATHEPVPHAPDTAGQTPRGWFSGIRSLHLLRSMDDPDPVLIFSHGDGYVEASYADGADTIVGSAPLSSLPSGTFTWARVVHTHVRFTIDATAHGGATPVSGTLTDLVVLSDRTSIEGRTWNRGDYQWVFEAPGVEVPYEGTGWEVTPIPGGGFFARVEDGETAYYFPALVTVDPTLAEDQHFVFEVNVHEGFRWTDQAYAGYREDVFDVAWTGTEPIVQAGANGYAYSLE